MISTAKVSTKPCKRNDNAVIRFLVQVFSVYYWIIKLVKIKTSGYKS